MTTRIYRKKVVSAEDKRRHNLSTRYGMTPAAFDAMMAKQNNLCGICGSPMERPVVDHDHVTGAVRGLLCHGCNIKLPAVEDMGWVMLAWAYLEGDSGEE